MGLAEWLARKGQELAALGAAVQAQGDQLVEVVEETPADPGMPLGTAQWLSSEIAIEKFRYPNSALNCGRVWIGEAPDQDNIPLGYADDRHVTLVSGSRGGKGAGVIVPNLCFWAGLRDRCRSERRERKRNRSP